ncbi:MAG: DNA-3-methyladenine glycosylase 2 family protein [Pseudomonadota bacterium]
MPTFSLPKPVGFRLSAVQDYYAHFTPGSGMAAAALDRLTLAFRLDGTFAPVAVSLREQGDALCVELVGEADPAVVAKQLGRIMGLEADAEAWFALGESDLVVGDLQREFPGFLSAAKASPYEAATWAVISPRMGQPQAARIKQAMARELGDALELNGKIHFVFPSPARLRVLERFPGLSDEKIERLRGVAQAAGDGLLDAERLRDLGEVRALTELQKLRGVGPWAASHIYFRGAAPCDGLPTAEPRVLHGLAAAYRLRSPSVATFQRIAAGWRPFRTWVCVLLMRHLAVAGGWHAPGLDEERARAGRALLRRTSAPA